MERRAVVVPGAHDALSAKVIEKCGFEAIQVSGYGVAGSLLGKPDVGLVQMKDVLDVTWNIAQAVEHPGDGRRGHRRRQRGERGLDHRTADRHGRGRYEHRRPGVPQALRPHGGQGGHRRRRDGRQGEGLRRAAATGWTRTSSSTPAPTRCRPLGLDEAIRRCNLYLEAGADLGFIDGIKTRADVEQAVRRFKGPLSVNLMDAISGMKTELIPIPDLAAMGVGRVSIPVASIMVAHKALMEFFAALKASPTGTLPGQTQWVTSVRGVHRLRGPQGLQGHGGQVPARAADGEQVRRRDQDRGMT